MKLIIIFFASMAMLIDSCAKQEVINSTTNERKPPILNMTPDSLRGREFIFSNLEWFDENGFGYPAVYLVDSNLFMPNRYLSVEIKYDTLNVWEMLYRFHLGFGILKVYPEPAPLPALQLLFGKIFSIRVKFS